MENLTQLQVSAVALIFKAFKELSEKYNDTKDNDKFYTIEEFCTLLNMRPFGIITIEQIKDIIPKMAFMRLLDESKWQESGLYRYKISTIATQGLTID